MASMDVWDLAQVRKNFSFVEPCLRMWELNRPLRELGIKGKHLVVQEDEHTITVFVPSLGTISKNYRLLKPFTQHMSETGVVCTCLTSPIEAAVKEFYSLMQCDVKSDVGVAVCHKVATNIKKMLHVLRRKWKKWEMPRVPQHPKLKYHFDPF